MSDLRHHCSRFSPLLAKASTRGVEVRCRDCKSLVLFPTTALLPLLLGVSTGAAAERAVMNVVSTNLDKPASSVFWSMNPR